MGTISIFNIKILYNKLLNCHIVKLLFKAIQQFNHLTMKLSLCMATFNEEKFIHYPLDSAIDLVDEVVIVDGESTDKTVEKARSYGRKVRIIKAKNLKMFHKNKQRALDATRGDWILQLDADEELSDDLKTEIQAILQDPSESVAYWIPRKNYFLGRFLMKGGQFPDYTIRLYKNGVARFPCKSVHENVEIKGKIGHLKNPMLHYADPSFARYLKRWHRYNDLDAAELRKKFQIILGIDYCIAKPLKTFLSMYFRHKGFMDGWQGFVFAFFSSIRFIPIYIKWKKTKF